MIPSSALRAALRPRQCICSSNLLRRTTPPQLRATRQRRWLSVAPQPEPVGAPEVVSQPKAAGVLGVVPSNTSDADLRDMFDSPKAWKGFVDHSSPNVGLFGNRYL